MHIGLNCQNEAEKMENVKIWLKGRVLLVEE